MYDKQDFIGKEVFTIVNGVVVKGNIIREYEDEDSYQIIWKKRKEIMGAYCSQIRKKGEFYETYDDAKKAIKKLYIKKIPTFLWQTPLIAAFFGFYVTLFLVLIIDGCTPGLFIFLVTFISASISAGFCYWEIRTADMPDTYKELKVPFGDYRG